MGVWEIVGNFAVLVTLVWLVDLPKDPGLLVAHWEFPESLVAFSGEQSNGRSFAPSLLSTLVDGCTHQGRRKASKVYLSIFGLR